MRDTVRFFLPIALLLIFYGIASPASEPISQIRVQFSDKQDVIQIQSLGLDIVSRSDSYIEIMATEEDRRRLDEAGLDYAVIHEDVTEFYRTRIARYRSPADMGGYMTLSEIEAALDAIIADHPTIVSPKQSIGTTIEGRNQWAVKISDNPTVDEDEPEILFFSAIHAREVITPLVLLHFMDYLTDQYGSATDATELVDGREIWFILVANPDGYYYNEVIEPGGGGMWRKNRRNNLDGSFGIDLNRNWGYQWGYDDYGSSGNTSSETYRGTGPFSEPETANMAVFIESREFEATISYHSYSNLVIWPWGYDYLYTPDEDIFSQLGDSIAAWNNYSPGVGWTLYVTNGDTDDWAYGEQTTKEKCFALTFEVGSSQDGFWPDPARIPDMVAENLQPNLFLARMAGSEEYLRAPGQPEIFLPATVDSSSYTVEWTALNDSLNPAVDYELVELRGPQTVTDDAVSLDSWINNGFVVSSDRSYSGGSSFYSTQGDGLFNTITSKYPYPVLLGDTLRCYTWYAIELDWDYAYVEVSTDGQVFTPIAGNLTTDYNPNGNNKGNGITGFSSSWQEGIFDLSGYVGQDIFIRFTYSTDSYVQEEGFYVDVIYPVAVFDTETTVSSSIVDTSYQFVDRSIGLYYYKVRGRDAQNQYGLYSALSQTLVTGGGQCIDADSDGFGDPDAAGNDCPDDNCVLAFNPGQEDADGDGIGDACDECPGFDDLVDTDEDGIADGCDNCPDVHNPGQEDSDQDGIGDVCETCCVGIAGNVDNDPNEIVDIGDLTGLIGYLFIPPFVEPICMDEGNVDGIGTVDIGDLTALIGYLFIPPFTPPAPCQ